MQYPTAIVAAGEIALRPLVRDYLPALHVITSDVETRSMWRTRGRYWSPQELEGRLTQGVFYSLVITDADDASRLFGVVELLDTSLDDAKSHLSIVVAKDQWNTGLGVRATLLFAEHVFEIYQLDKLAISVLSSNARLIAGLTSILDPEGVLKREVHIEGRWHDLHLFALWRNDLQQLQLRARGDLDIISGTSLANTLGELIASYHGDQICESGDQLAMLDTFHLDDADSLLIVEAIALCETAIGRDIALGAFGPDQTFGDLVRFSIENAPTSR